MKRINPLDWLIHGAIYFLYRTVKNCLCGGGDKSKQK